MALLLNWFRGCLKREPLQLMPSGPHFLEKESQLYVVKVHPAKRADLQVTVTGSGKRYIVAHTMIFLYKRCCSNIFYSLKNVVA